MNGPVALWNKSGWDGPLIVPVAPVESDTFGCIPIYHEGRWKVIPESVLFGADPLPPPKLGARCWESPCQKQGEIWWMESVIERALGGVPDLIVVPVTASRIEPSYYRRIDIW